MVSATPPSAATGHQAGRTITFYVALAVFAQEVTWNFFDSQVPPLLRAHLTSTAVVGLLMGMDNLLGIFIQPWMGNRSDRTRTRWGRRVPYLVAGMPAAALVFLLIPQVAGSLSLLIATMVVYAVICNGFKPVSESLLPDFITPERRSRANAVVKIAAGLTTLVAALISILLVDDHPSAAFAIPSLLMLAAIAVIGFRVRDSRSRGYQRALAEDESAGSRIRVRTIILGILRDEDRSRLLLILGIFVFGCAWAAVRALMTPYGQEALAMSRGAAGGLALPSGIAYLAAAIPAALLAERFGRIKVMVGGIAIFIAAMALGTIWQQPTGSYVAFALGAAGAAGFMINAVVALWNLAPSARVIGTYTGLYTVGWASGAFLGPAMVGAFVDLTSWRSMLVGIGVIAALAALVITRVGVLQRNRAAAP